MSKQPSSSLRVLKESGEAQTFLFIQEMILS